MIALLSGIVALFFVIFPNRAPWTTFRADLSETGMEHNVRVEEFEQRGYAKLLDLRDEEEISTKTPYQAADETPIEPVEEKPYQPEDVGNIVSFKLETEGLQRKKVYLRWSVFKESGQRVNNSELNDQPGWPIGWFSAGHRVAVRHGDIFVPLPRKDGTYYVEIEAWYETEARLNSIDTDEFVITNGKSQKV